MKNRPKTLGSTAATIRIVNIDQDESEICGCFSCLAQRLGGAPLEGSKLGFLGFVYGDVLFPPFTHHLSGMISIFSRCFKQIQGLFKVILDFLFRFRGCFLFFQVSLADLNLVLMHIVLIAKHPHWININSDLMSSSWIETCTSIPGVA